MISLLKQALAENHLNVNDHVIDQLIHYLHSLNKWNKVINLTSITNVSDMIYLHLIDSLLIAPFLEGQRFLDIGTGGGLPGIPLALMLQNTQWFLLDKAAKKTHFLLQMKVELNLHNVEIITSRTEDFHPATKFDCIVSRAYGSLRVLTEATKHLLQPNGIWCFMKGRYPSEELNDLPAYVKMLEVVPVHLKGATVERHLVKCKL